MNIVTVGGGFLDIDGLGAGVAYAELLNVLGRPAQFVCTGKLNGSVTPTIRSWNLPIITAYAVNNDDCFVVVDNSSPDWLESFIDERNITEIIDHHLGHEAYWQERGVKTDIEFIGACSTQIYERWAKAGKLDDMSALSAGLLASGILDNTLNFKASVTTERDRAAFADVLRRSDLGEHWPERYFEECQGSVEQRLEQSLINDTKQGINYPGLAEPVNISQLVVWDGRHFLQRKDELLKLTERYGAARSINILSISEGRNYFITPSRALCDFYERILGVRYGGDMAESDRLWLRKEIMKAAIERGTSSEF